MLSGFKSAQLKNKPILSEKYESFLFRIESGCALFVSQDQRWNESVHGKNRQLGKIGLLKDSQTDTNTVK